jgi:RNA polymerase sigma-70 factor (family 1)
MLNFKEGTQTNTPMDESRDKELIKQMRVGNEDAFNLLYKRHWIGLFNFVYRILRDEQVVEDCLQEVFTTIWLKRKTLNDQNIKSLLYTSARNAAISHLRKIKFTQVHQDALNELSIDPSVESKINTEEIKIEVMRIMTLLPKRCKEIFYQSRFQELSIDEISKKFDISRRTVENQLSLALKHIRTHFPHGLLVSVMSFFFY